MSQQRLAELIYARDYLDVRIGQVTEAAAADVPPRAVDCWATALAAEEVRKAAVIQYPATSGEFAARRRAALAAADGWHGESS